jgi:hypothetical protein
MLKWAYCLAMKSLHTAPLGWDTLPIEPSKHWKIVHLVPHWYDQRARTGVADGAVAYLKIPYKHMHPVYHHWHLVKLALWSLGGLLPLIKQTITISYLLHMIAGASCRCSPE